MPPLSDRSAQPLQADRLRQSDFLNQLIIDRTTTEELGRVEVLWMYVPRHRVLGFVGKSGLLGNKKFAFKLSQVTAIGEGGIVTQGQPEATTPDRVKRLESLMQHEVWTEGGERLGKITDYVFNLQTGEITHYLFVSSDLPGFLSGICQVSPRWIVSTGDQRILLASTAIVEPYQESLTQKLTKTAETLKSEAVQEWRSIAQKATGQFQQMRSQMQERTQEVSERLREEAQTLAERAKEQSQTLAEQVKEQSQIISKQLEEGIQTLTVQAEEIFDRSDLPQTRQYSYEEADFDWDWDELDEEPSAVNPDLQNQSAPSSRRGFNDFIDRAPVRPASAASSNETGSSHAKADSVEAIDPEMIDPDAIDDFDFDNDFWSDAPARPASVKPQSGVPEKVQPPVVQENPPAVQPSDPIADSADLDDEPWI